MLEAVTTAAPAMPLAARAGPADQEMMAILPPQPKTIRDTGLDRQLVLALLVKAIHQAGIAHLPILAGKLRLSISVLREAFEILTAEQMAEIAMRGETDIDIQYRLTDRGKALAAECLAQSRYVGPAPVTLDAFRATLLRDAERNAVAGRITPGELAAALADDGIDAGVRERLGAALHSGRALLLYGPSGSGKTWLARKLGRLLQGVVAVPSAILIEQQIVQFYDPQVHQKPRPVQGRQFEERNCDTRWRICQRPIVQVGTELTRAMLDLRYDAGSGTYRAPPHCKASGGVLLIDDFGRQQIAAAEVLNRFIGPLDNGTDLLTIEGGHTEAVPFPVTLVFATNLAPQQLLDEPLLRRVGYKIQVGGLSEASYRALLRRQCLTLQVAYDEGAADYLVARLHAAGARPLLPSYPRELLSRIADFASFAGTAPCLTIPALEQAWSSMFACAAPAPSPVPASIHRPDLLVGDRS
jgi:energy-coupling factor transporter ATP-binding protein EcfA2